MIRFLIKKLSKIKQPFQKSLEWSGVLLAIFYSLLIALNIGAEVLSFILLFTSAVLIAFWAFLGDHRGVLLLQLFYIGAAIVGIIRWY